MCRKVTYWCTSLLDDLLVLAAANIVLSLERVTLTLG